MARQRTFKHNVFLRLSQIEHALSSFYAKQYDRDQTAVIRGMIKQYVRADERFDATKFKRYVEDTFIPEAGGDGELNAEIRAQVAQFIESIRTPGGARHGA